MTTTPNPVADAGGQSEANASANEPCETPPLCLTRIAVQDDGYGLIQGLAVVFTDEQGLSYRQAILFRAGQSKEAVAELLEQLAAFLRDGDNGDWRVGEERLVSYELNAPKYPPAQEGA